MPTTRIPKQKPTNDMWDVGADDEWHARSKRVVDIALGMAALLVFAFALAVMSAWRDAGAAV